MIGGMLGECLRAFMVDIGNANEFEEATIVSSCCLECPGIAHVVAPHDANAYHCDAHWSIRSCSNAHEISSIQ